MNTMKLKTKQKSISIYEDRIQRNSSQRKSNADLDSYEAIGRSELDLDLFKSQKINVQLDAKSNMSKLADQLIPQMSAMQKNNFGLLFFNELSQNIVKDNVAQQLSMMPGTQLASVINGLEQKVCDSAVPLMLDGVSEEVRTGLIC